MMKPCNSASLDRAAGITKGAAAGVGSVGGGFGAMNAAARGTGVGVVGVLGAMNVVDVVGLTEGACCGFCTVQEDESGGASHGAT